MLRIATILGVLGILIAVPASAELVQSGQIVMEWHGGGMGGGGAGGGERQCNLVVNSDFESGDLPPWTTNAWYVTNTDAHSGTYSATDVGNFWIMQDVVPTDVSQIVEVSFWCRQPEVAIQAVDLFYGPVDYDEFLLFPGAAWSLQDVTGMLRPAGMLQAIRIWGYSGAGPDEDRTYIDDVMIDGNIITPVADGSWGLVKNLFR